MLGKQPAMLWLMPPPPIRSRNAEQRIALHHKMALAQPNGPFKMLILALA